MAINIVVKDPVAQKFGLEIIIAGKRTI